MVFYHQFVEMYFSHCCDFEKNPLVSSFNQSMTLTENLVMILFYHFSCLLFWLYFMFSFWLSLGGGVISTFSMAF